MTIRDCDITEYKGKQPGSLSHNYQPGLFIFSITGTDTKKNNIKLRESHAL